MRDLGGGELEGRFGCGGLIAVQPLGGIDAAQAIAPRTSKTAARMMLACQP
jgi:hypothetical protein